MKKYFVIPGILLIGVCVILYGSLFKSKQVSFPEAKNCLECQGSVFAGNNIRLERSNESGKLTTSYAVMISNARKAGSLLQCEGCEFICVTDPYAVAIMNDKIDNPIPMTGNYLGTIWLAKKVPVKICVRNQVGEWVMIEKNVSKIVLH